jgi:hypothetical protein
MRNTNVKFIAVLIFVRLVYFPTVCKRKFDSEHGIKCKTVNYLTSWWQETKVNRPCISERGKHFPPGSYACVWNPFAILDGTGEICVL